MVKCLIEVYINFTSEFDRGHGPLKEVFDWLVCSFIDRSVSRSVDWWMDGLTD